ncbi:MAG: DUF2628 domain-containing protein [Candidatus Anstonellales archaeon]
MKEFYIYENKLFGHLEAVKNGFSWPGFFFTLWWLAYKKMWAEFALYLAVVILMPFVISAVGMPTESIAVFNTIFGISLSIALGLYGNKRYAKHLIKKGYVKIGEIVANSKDDAVYNFIIRKKNINGIVPTRNKDYEEASSV